VWNLPYWRFPENLSSYSLVNDPAPLRETSGFGETSPPPPHHVFNLIKRVHVLDRKRKHFFCVGEIFFLEGWISFWAKPVDLSRHAPHMGFGSLAKCR
jgi:hypothetical protein